MAAQFRCVRGHLWEDFFEPSVVDGEVRCPECGQASHPELGSGLHATSDVAPEALPAAGLATRVVAAVAGEASPVPPGAGATVFHPQLADLPASAVDEAEVIVPSCCLPAGGNGQPAEPTAPRRADWPDLPGYEILQELGRGGIGSCTRPGSWPSTAPSPSR